jgi:hypothetical protein
MVCGLISQNSSPLLALSVPIRENLPSQREENPLCLGIGPYKNGLQELLGTIHASHSDGEWPIFGSAVKWNVRKGQHSRFAMIRSSTSASSVLTSLPVATVLSVKPPKTTSNKITTPNRKIPIIGCWDGAEEEIPQDYR